MELKSCVRIVRNREETKHTIPRIKQYTVWRLAQGFPGSSDGKNLPAMQETQVQSLGWEDYLEKGIAIHSSILAWRIPWTEEPDELQSVGSGSQT